MELLPTPTSQAEGWNEWQKEIIKHNGATCVQWNQEGERWTVMNSSSSFVSLLQHTSDCSCKARATSYPFCQDSPGRNVTEQVMHWVWGWYFLSSKSGGSRLLSASHPVSSRGWLLMQYPSLPVNCCTMIYLSQDEQGLITCLLSWCKRVGRGLWTEANEEICLKGDLTPVRRKQKGGKDGHRQKKKRSMNISNTAGHS